MSRVGSGLRFVAFVVALAVSLVGGVAIVGWSGLDLGGRLDAPTVLALQGVQLPVVAALTAAALRLDRCPWSAAGLPFGRRAPRHLAEGLVVGLGLATLAVGAVALGGAEVHRGAGGLGGAVLWAAAFLLVGASEELMFRGYALARLGEAIGFWPAAVLLASVFGAGHLVGESPWGALNAAGFALVASLALRRTGGLWYPMGIHAAWDWALPVLYGVPTSGVSTDERLLAIEPHGPGWWTGGSDGPEGSIAAFVALAILAAGLRTRFPRTETLV